MTGQAANGKTTATGTAVWDLEAAAKAAAAEADDAPFTFAYKDSQFTIPASRKWPARATAALSAGELATALPQILGQDAWDELCDLGLDLGELNTLFEKIAEMAGFESVPNTGPPARRSSARR